MLRKSQAFEEEKVDRWLVSYADFITLLFAFFVVMYSISQVNEGKYRVLSESLISAFDTTPKSSQPIQTGDFIPTTDDIASQLQPGETSGKEDLNQEEPQEDNYASREAFERMEKNLQQSLSELIDSDLVTIKKNKDWLEIDLRSALLFQSGSDRLSSNANPVLEEIAATLKENQHLVHIRGHTDNIPIETERFSSNWQLSAARAVSVVRKLQNDLSPQRLTAEGYGEHKPVASNLTADGRAKNRRVTIAVSRYLWQPQANESEAVTGVDAKSDSQKSDLQNNSQQINAQQKNDGQAGESTAPPKTAKPTEEESEPTYEIVRLPGGGLLIRGKKLPAKESDKKQ